jgi:hypothetical protein
MSWFARYDIFRYDMFYTASIQENNYLQKIKVPEAQTKKMGIHLTVQVDTHSFAFNSFYQDILLKFFL